MSTLNLKDYHILQNEVQTAEIQAVFDEADRMGRCTVVIPEGTYITGTLNIKSASIYLEKGAVLMGSPNISDYYANEFEHNEMKETISLLYSMEHDDIRISGEGTIDLNGEAFYEMDEACVPDYGVEFTQEQKDECTRPIGVRPTQPIFFYHCNHMVVSGICVKNAPCWTMSFHACDDVKIMGLTIRNSQIIPNNDGMHFCGSRNVIIHGCNIIAGDDCIALSGITDWDQPCENFTISDCVMSSASKTIVLGYIHSIIRNVVISNCVIYNSQRGICFMAKPGTGLVEHVLVQNVRIDTHVRAGNWWGNGEAIELMGVDHDYDGYLHGTPERALQVSIQDVQFRNISCSSENVIALIGEQNSVRNIVLDGISFERKDSKNRYLKGDRLIDTSPSRHRYEVPDGGTYWLYVTGCENVQVRNTMLTPYHGEILKSSLEV